MFGTPPAETYLVTLYDEVTASIYSDPHGGFGDMFKAVRVRAAIVSALRYTNGSEVLCLLVKVMERDPAPSVRWEAADVVEKLSNESACRVKDRRIVSALRRLVTDMQQEKEKGELGTSGTFRLERYSRLLDRLER